MELQFLNNPYLAGFIGSIIPVVIGLLIYDWILRCRMRNAVRARQAIVDKERNRHAHLKAMAKKKGKPAPQQTRKVRETADDLGIIDMASKGRKK